jgi:integrase/recombinase XerC
MVTRTEKNSSGEQTTPSSSSKAPFRVPQSFALHIESPATRRIYLRHIQQFSAWCDSQGLIEFQNVKREDIERYVEVLRKQLAKPSVRQRVAAIRTLFDSLVVSNAIVTSPAATLRQFRSRRHATRSRGDQQSK